MLKVKRKVTYKLYPSRRQQEALDNILRLHQRLYNAALEHRIGAYKKAHRTIGFFDQCAELTKLRAEIEDYKDLNAQSCQVTLKRLERFHFEMV
jgi:putative transposase